MSYLGRVELKSSEIRRVNVTGSTSATHTLTWTPPSEQSLIITINGIKQQNNYTISGVTLTLDTALIATDAMEVVGILDIGEAVTPPDDSISTVKIQDDAVTADKLANSINTEITANTAKVTNATHTGDVTGATALTIAADAVDIAMLSATGVASATTFLRGDNAWATAGSKPVCTAYMTGNQSFSKNVRAKVDFDGVSFDTQSWYDTTNQRYTPQEAGYYWCQAFLVKQGGETQVNSVFTCIYKNGSNVQCNYYYDDWPWYTMQMAFEVSMPVYCNGSTDYVEVHFEWGANGTLGLYSGGSHGQGSKFHIFKMD